MGHSIVILFFLLVIVFIIVLKVAKPQTLLRTEFRKSACKDISAVEDGDVVKIVGQLVPVGELISAPLSGRKCCFYDVRIEEKRHYRATVDVIDKGNNWYNLVEEQKSSAFVIEDGGNYAFINTQKLKATLAVDETFRSGFLNDASDTLEEFLKRNGQTSRGVFGLNKKLRFEEGVLEKGDTVAVLGKCRWMPAVELGLPEKYGYLLAITPNDGLVYVSNDPDIAHK